MASIASVSKKGTTVQLLGYFDGKDMISNSDEEDVYPVPANYASKSMLIPGDKLKLFIQPDGKMIYKVIDYAARTQLKGILHIKDRKYMALGSNNISYILNNAAITYFKAQCGDEVSLVINEKEPCNYAALVSVLKYPKVNITDRSGGPAHDD